jgi:hypothetical protein
MFVKDYNFFLFGIDCIYSFKSSDCLKLIFVLILFLLIGQQCTASISDCPISHSIQLTNPFLGLPLEFGKCESCGTSEPGQCEGQFLYFLSDAYIYIYHCLFDFS